jgi:soluble lytic murein transglycosylase-like protein
MVKKTAMIVIIALSLVCTNRHYCFSDIYMFIDGHGVAHFTDVPTSTDYKIYIKERREIVKPRISTKKYDAIIQKAQKKYGVEFFLIKAVIQVESGFNPEAVSKKGARGLMQIMPANYEKLFVRDPFNPSQNVMGGTLYLKRLLEKYEYKLPMALAAYNAGPNAVDKYKRIPPYKETQDYVRKVMEVYSTYKQSS